MTDTTPEMKSFHLGDILTITTGIMVAPEGIGAVYEILNWMTGDNLFTHQLPRASDLCEPILKDLYPGLAEVTLPDASGLAKDKAEEFWKTWLAMQVETFGETLPVPKLENYTPVDPISELFTMRGELKSDAKIIVVAVDGTDDPAAIANEVVDFINES